MRLLFAGTPEVAIPTLRKLHQTEHEIVGVITRPDAPVGRGKVMTPSPVSDCASQLGLPIIKSSKLNEEATVQQILQLKPDLAVIVAYGALIRRPLLNAFPWVNLHFSLLPSYRGAAPVQHALLNGEEITGVTAFLLDEGLDTGPILGQLTERIRTSDTTGTLLARLSDGGADLIAALLAQWSELEPKTQSSDGVSFAPKIDIAMARIDWTRSGELVERHIRAMNPAPGAWTTLAGERIGILAATLAEKVARPGEVLISKDEVLVGTGSRTISLREVKPQGKRAMAATDWARGVRTRVDFE